MDEAYLDDCVMYFISWPIRKVIFENPPETTRKQNPLPNTASSVGNTKAAGVNARETSGVTSYKTPTEKSQATSQVILKSSCYIII